MNIANKKAFACVLLAFVGVFLGKSAEAQTVAEVWAPETSGRLDLTYQASKNRDEQSSLFGKLFYIERSWSETASVTFTAYHDQEFWSVYPGVSFKSGNFYAGIGAGVARYSGKNWTAVNPWLWYGDEKRGIEALLHVERYLRDKKDPWYVKGYVWKKVGEKFLIGVYGETFVGVGPAMGTYLTPKVKLWAYVPVALRPDEGRMRLVAGLTYEF